jgi:toxin CcdB
MARYDIYPDPEQDGAFLVDVQADILRDLNTRVVVPLRPPSAAPLPARGLNPSFTIDGQNCVLVTQFLSAVPRGILRRPVGSLTDRSDEVLAALDLLLTGV